ncbi:hypothetical protein QJQ45_004564 [Haematococcus lacustris]|nr:hypothetical protein QJQ45_004564 [Haematococcus lacustris]
MALYIASKHNSNVLQGSSANSYGFRFVQAIDKTQPTARLWTDGGPSRCLVLPVRAAAASGSGMSPVPPEPLPRVPSSSQPPVPPAYLKSSAPLGSGYSTAGVGGTGGPSSPAIGTGGSGSQPGPGGVDMNKMLLGLLALAVAVPLYNWITKSFIKTDVTTSTSTSTTGAVGSVGTVGAVDRTVVVVEDRVKTGVPGTATATSGHSSSHSASHAKADLTAKGKHAVDHGKTVAGNAGLTAQVELGKAGRAVQHKAEDVKDAVDINTHNLGHKAERGLANAKKEIKHVAEDTKHALVDGIVSAEHKAHEAKVKSGRAVHRAAEKIGDTLHDTEVVAVKASRNVLDNIKGAATSVGRKMHLVADSTEKGVRNTLDKTGRGVDHASVTKTTVVTTTTVDTDRRAAYYTAGGVAMGAGVLAALYYWDRKGGDLKGKMMKLQHRTAEAVDHAAVKAKGALARTAQEPSGPNAIKATTTTSTTTTAR